MGRTCRGADIFINTSQNVSWSALSSLRVIEEECDANQAEVEAYLPEEAAEYDRPIAAD